MIAVAFFLSGAAALVYQVVWQRLLVFTTGVGIVSISTIVAAFMAGLGLGSWAGGRLSARLSPRAALLGFAGAELAIAVFGAQSAHLFYDVLYRQAGHLYSSPGRAVLFHIAALLPPTALMGVSLPLLVRGVVRDVAGAGHRIGMLYAVNTLGAACGALLAPWLLMRLLGLRGALYVAAAANLAAAAIVFVVRGRTTRDAPADAPAETPAAAVPRRRVRFGAWLILYGITGFIALSLEILWFRLVEVAAKPTAFTFGTVLALYLLGLGAGTVVSVAALSRIRDPARAFLACQCALLAVAGLSLTLLVRLPPGTPGLAWYVSYFGDYKGVILGTEWNSTVPRVYFGLPLLLFGLPTFLMGFSFPLLQKAVQDEPRTSGLKVGLLQAANIAGCVAGSLLVGLVALRVTGTAGTLRALLVMGVGLALMGARLFADRRFVALAAVLLALVLVLPGQEALWRRLHGVVDGEALIAEDATGVTVLRSTDTVRWHLSVSGVPHSWLPYGGIHTALGAVPVLIHPQPRRVAVVGLGSGDTAWGAGVRAETEQVRVFEISSPQPGLLRRLAERPGRFPGLRELLADPRVTLEIADGRIGLEREPLLYDIIEMDPLHSDSAFSGQLYSLEFYRHASERLMPGGLFCTWAPTPRAYTTFLAALPHVLEFAAGSVLVGSRDPIPFAPDTWQTRLNDRRTAVYLGPRGINNVREVIRSWRPAELPAGGRVLPNEDLFPRDEFARSWRDW